MAALNLSPEAFYAHLYQWPEEEGSTKRPDARAAAEEVDRLLAHLRQKIRDSGSTQAKIQRRYGWGRSYVSQLLTKQKAIRLDQLLSILQALALSGREFFWELYRPEQFLDALKSAGAEARIETRLSEVTRALGELCATLVEKGLLHAWDLPDLFRPPATSPPPHPATGHRQLPLLSKDQDE